VTTATAREPLTRARIVDAALTIARRDGLAAASMRAIGRELDVSTMAAYRHVPDHEAIVSEVIRAHMLPLGRRSFRTAVQELYSRMRIVDGLPQALLDSARAELLAEIADDLAHRLPEGTQRPYDTAVGALHAAVGLAGHGLALEALNVLLDRLLRTERRPQGWGA
jgi:AcrR family transcriptional regulator